jgi:hypothetical protein
MAKKAAAKTVASSLRLEKSGHRPDTTPQKPSALMDTHVVYCGDNLEQLKKLPDDFVSLPAGWQSGSGMQANSLTLCRSAMSS